MFVSNSLVLCLLLALTVVAQGHSKELSSELNSVTANKHRDQPSPDTQTNSIPESLTRHYVQQQVKEPRKTPTTQATNSKLLLPYRTYRDVQIVHFKLPEETFLASWKFLSNWTKSSKCRRRKITVHLRHGAFPIVNPDNSTFPSDMYLGGNSFTSLSFEADIEPTYLNISAPLSGDWFAVAYIEEDTDKIVQKGLFAVCETWLHSQVSYYIEESVISLMPSVTLKNDAIRKDQFYRFFTSHNIWSAEITVTKCSVTFEQNSTTNKGEGDCPISVYSRPLALPRGNFEEETSVNCSLQQDCRLEVTAVADGWNYVLVKVNSLLTEVQFEITVNTAACEESKDDSFEVADVPLHPNSRVPKFEGMFKSLSHKFMEDRNESLIEDSLILDTEPAPFGPSSKSCWPRIPLVRNNLLGNFAYHFDQLPDVNDSTPILINFSMNAVSLLSFELTSMLDTGGTLALEMILPKTVNTTEKNVSISVCMEHLIRPRLNLYSGSCLSPMSLSVNTSSFKSRFGTLLIPFPQAGRWYLSLSAICYSSQSVNDSSEVQDTFVPCDDNHTSVFLQIKSSACIQGQCGAYGNCYQYISGSFIYSTCVCGGGWRGWGCSDNSTAVANSVLLTSVLLLTLSNVFFLPAIVLAFKRKYYIEGVIYLATMFFSTMYHACDAEIFSYCIMKLSVLQFCDFYLAILSVWVTLIAMAQIPLGHPFQSLAHEVGAIGVAIGVVYDRTGLWIFIVPVGLAIFIILLSWTNQCKKTRHCYPRGRIWALFLLPGVVIAAVGLCLYAFLETRSNYQYIHSGWHACMALCILFLLPKKRKVEDKGCLSWEENGNVNCNSYVQVEAPISEDNHSNEQLLPSQQQPLPNL